MFHLKEAELEVDELLDEDVFGGGDGLVLFEQVVDGSGDEVWAAEEMGVMKKFRSAGRLLQLAQQPSASPAC